MSRGCQRQNPAVLHIADMLYTMGMAMTEKRPSSIRTLHDYFERRWFEVAARPDDEPGHDFEAHFIFLQFLKAALKKEQDQ